MLKMHWLGPYVINFITNGVVVQFQQLDGAMLPNIVNGSRLNPYRQGPLRRGA